MNLEGKVFSRRRKKVMWCLGVAALVISVAGFLATQPACRVINETQLEGGGVVQDIRLVEMDLWYRLLPPQRYLKMMEVMGKPPGEVVAYPGKKRDWTYPVFQLPYQEEASAEANEWVVAWLDNSRGFGKGIDDWVIITWYMKEDAIILQAERSYYPFFAVRPLEESEVYKVALKNGNP